MAYAALLLTLKDPFGSVREHLSVIGGFAGIGAALGILFSLRFRKTR